MPRPCWPAMPFCSSIEDAMRDLTRRDLLKIMGSGMGTLGLAAAMGQGKLLAADNAVPHFRPRAKRLIHLFMNGGPSHVDTFDPKPALTTYAGTRPPAANLSTERKTFALMPSPFPFRKHGKSGLEISSLFPRVAQHVDDLCV